MNEIPQTRVEPAGWNNAIAQYDGPQIVVGGPGTGKTQFLVRRAVHLVGESDVAASRIFLLGFGRRGTVDIEQRLQRDLSGSTPRLSISTLHSLAARILERHAMARGWSLPPRILTGPEQVDVIRRLLAGTPRRKFSAAFRGLLASPTFAKEVTDFVLRAREQVLTADELAARAVERDEWRGLPQFIARYDAELHETNRIDYGTLLAEAVHLAEDLGSAAVGVDAPYLLVDEYQDATAAQVRLIELIAGDDANVTAAGDPYQSIYSFRGADLTNVADFPRRFRARCGLPARRMVLTTSFRTTRPILEAAVRITAGELPKAVGPVIPAHGNGRVEVFRFGQETEEAEWTASEIQRIHLEEGLPYRRIGVFVRNKRQFVPNLVRALDRRGISYNGPDQGRPAGPAVHLLLDLVAAATGSDGPAETSRAARRVLLGSLCSLPLSKLQEIERARFNGAGGVWPDAIRLALPTLSDLAELLDNPFWAEKLPAASGLFHVWSHLAAFTSVVMNPARSHERKDWGTLSRVLARWSERNPTSTLVDYRRLIEDGEFEERPLLARRLEDGDRPTITTLHQSKGLEFDVVFIADAAEGTFPDVRSRDSLLGVRHLLTHLPAGSAEYRAFRLQEERRLAYTAMTRARRRVIWTATATGADKGRAAPSRFLALAAGTTTVAEALTPPPDTVTPVTPREAEGLLRRTFQNSKAPAIDRLAALTVLAERRDERLRNPLEFAGTRKRGSDNGIMPNKPCLSPSQAEAYLRCPRRYVLERKLRVAPRPSFHLRFGTLIHDVLERVENAALADGAPRGTPHQAAEVFAASFDPETFGGPPFSEAWRRRGRKLIAHLYENWPSDGSVLATEYPLQLEVDDTHWHGRADRIETTDSCVTVVDYKTARSPLRSGDGAQSLQLGFYLLAARTDSGISRMGRPIAAEMWFPATSSRDVTRRTFNLINLGLVRSHLAEAAAGITAEDWTPRPSPGCERCPQRPVCPVWFGSREGFV